MSELSKAGQRRRKFLSGVVATGGATTALLTMGAIADSESETQTPAAASEQKPKGYHVTSHIRTYYEKAQV